MPLVSPNWQQHSTEVNNFNNNVVKVIWYKAASPPYTDNSIIFAKWCQCAPQSSMSQSAMRLGLIELRFYVPFNTKETWTMLHLGLSHNYKHLHVSLPHINADDGVMRIGDRCCWRTCEDIQWSYLALTTAKLQTQDEQGQLKLPSVYHSRSSDGLLSRRLSRGLCRSTATEYQLPSTSTQDLTCTPCSKKSKPPNSWR